MRDKLVILMGLILTPVMFGRLSAAELIIPKDRQAYYADEPIELAVAGLPKDEVATIEIVPRNNTASVVKMGVKGDGSTVTFILPAGALSPGAYTVRLDGDDVTDLTISSGILDSTFLISQTISWDQLKQAGANFIVGNAFCFGKFSADCTGPLISNLRAYRSAGMNAFERAISENMPTLVYMYWTGYVTHKPFGTQKSWAAKDIQEAMRLLNFHTAQRLRRFGKNIVSVGTIDEPGLSWGKTPMGGIAPGFPNWDEKDWYEKRGWKFTDDPASRPDADWMKYISIRCGIIKESMAQAKKDLKTVWPDLVFSTDLYALQAIMDGTEALNQQVNDVPASHVFVDWGIDRLGAYSAIMLEKCHDPTSKLAHAMNGQLFGEVVPQPAQLYAYRVCLNGMLAAGIKSNWWLNTAGMTPADLAAVNNPAKRVGPLFVEADLGGHDVAVLWSFTEIAMREKEITAKEARRKADEQIKITVTSLPENTAIKEKEIEINAYSVGEDYREGVLTAHYALSRAGYPAHIIHERLLPKGILKNYKTLVIVGQTFPLPPDVMKAIKEFTARGGNIVVDQSTRIRFDHAIVAPVNLKGLSYRWNALFTQDPNTFKTLREASYFQTNHFMDEQVRKAVPAFKWAMGQTSSCPFLDTDSDEIVVERFVAGDGFIYVLINGYESLPQIPEDQKYWIYNYAPYRAKYVLKGLPKKCVVYAMEGSDWSIAGKLVNPKSAIIGNFEPGEMKIYLVAPREPKGLDLKASEVAGNIIVKARLKALKMVWPLTVTLEDASGKVLYQVYRATKADGTYEERFPIGMNAAAGIYVVRVRSPLANLSGEVQVSHKPTPIVPHLIKDAVRVFDGLAIKSFLASKPDLIIAVGSDSHKVIAEELAAGLLRRGFKVLVKPETEVLRKVCYPRVWNPYAEVYRATGEEMSLEGKRIETRITLATDTNGVITAKTEDGKELSDWRLPNSLVTIGGEGYVDFSGDSEICYEPGVKLYFDEHRKATVIKGTLVEEPTTDEFKARWSKPWTRLTTHVGAYQLPPQLPEAYTAENHLIVMGDSTTSLAVAVLQASDLLLQLVDEKYPGPGKSLISFVWSPFAVEKNVILIGAGDESGLRDGVIKLLELTPGRSPCRILENRFVVRHEAKAECR